MDSKKRKKLLKAGWKVGTVEELLDLDENDRRLINKRLRTPVEKQKKVNKGDYQKGD